MVLDVPVRLVLGVPEVEAGDSRPRKAKSAAGAGDEIGAISSGGVSFRMRYVSSMILG